MTTVTLPSTTSLPCPTCGASMTPHHHSSASTGGLRAWVEDTYREGWILWVCGAAEEGWHRQAGTLLEEAERRVSGWEAEQLREEAGYVVRERRGTK